MKTANLILLASFLAIYLSSCCFGKKKCDGIDSINTVEYIGFPESDIQKLYIYAYADGNNFVSPAFIDSANVNTGTRNSFYVGMVPGYQYIIKLSSASRTDTVNSITTAQDVCNNCPFNKDYFVFVNGYYLNGEHHTGTSIVIHK